MATTTVPEVNPEVKPKAAPVTLTPNAVSKVKEIMASQNPVPAGLRLSVQGGGCSGFQYSMAFENGAGMMDKVFEMDGLKGAPTWTTWRLSKAQVSSSRIPTSRAPAAAEVPSRPKPQLLTESKALLESRAFFRDKSNRYSSGGCICPGGPGGCGCGVPPG